jgi:hypothetical protein
MVKRAVTEGSLCRFEGRRARPPDTMTGGAAIFNSLFQTSPEGAI